MAGRIIDLTATVYFDKKETCRKFVIKFAQNEDFYSSITYDPADNLLTLDRTYSGFPHYIVHSRTIEVKKNEYNSLKLRILLDRNSVELFVNDGEKAMSAALYTPLDADSITFESKGNVKLDIEKYDLKF